MLEQLLHPRRRRPVPSVQAIGIRSLSPDLPVPSVQAIGIRSLSPGPQPFEYLPEERSKTPPSSLYREISTDAGAEDRPNGIPQSDTILADDAKSDADTEIKSLSSSRAYTQVSVGSQNVDFREDQLLVNKGSFCDKNSAKQKHKKREQHSVPVRLPYKQIPYKSSADDRQRLLAKRPQIETFYRGVQKSAGLINQVKRGHVNVAMDLNDEEQINQLSDLDLEVMEMDAIHPTIVPLSLEEEGHGTSPAPNHIPNGVRSHYKQNQMNNISPRAAKYRDSKLKLPRHITVPQARGATRQSSASPPRSPSQLGSVRGYPEGNVMSRSSSGTLRSLHSGIHGSIRGLSSKEGTLRIYQNNSTESTAGGFQSHHLPLTGTVSKAEMGFRRGNVRKEQLVTQFAVQLDQHERHRYLPGEEISGKIVFDLCGKLDIRFIEFLIIGQTSVSFARKGPNGYKTWRDVFLNKRSYIVGTPDGKWASTITAGHYVSKFRFRLPDGIPSSLKYKDDTNGFATEISYKVKARICDDIGSSSVRSTHSLHNYVKVLMTRQYSFMVKRPFDIHAIPMGLTPVTHTEDLSLSACSPFSTDLTSISLTLDRSCFLAGDEIKMRLLINNTTKHISKIRGELQQNVSVNKPRIQLTYTIADFEETDTRSALVRDNQQLYELAMPTHVNILPSINPGCRMLGVTYNLVVVIQFSACGGELTLDVPLSIGPCTDPVNLEKRNSVPVFNRPMRFPYFSMHDNGKISNGHVPHHMPHHVTSRVSKSGIRSKYSHTNTSVFCCWASDTLM